MGAALPKELPQVADCMIVGLAQDFNLQYLLKSESAKGYNILGLLADPDKRPDISYDVLENKMYWNQVEVQTKAVFYRPDFYMDQSKYTAEKAHDARDWHDLFTGWFLANPQIRLFNRGFGIPMRVNKLLALRMAVEVGLHVADTYYVNNVALYNNIAKSGEYIRKPMIGGIHTQLATPELGCSEEAHYSRPITVQAKMVSPELRLYRVGDKLMAFDMLSPSLDYREKNDVEIKPRSEVSADLAEKFIKLTDRLGLTYAAADLKTDPANGQLAFLEVNDAPMFPAFDRASNGALTKLIWDWLLK